ncbi:MAG TPA: alpha/beta hydrolase [Casimicrobiaceae bacterium]|nr:alpha/beta hydrolase [Casimicrobiaceae bacterium]
MALTSTLPRERHLRSLSAHGFHRVVYYEWGERDNPDVVVCVHGIGRNGRDFDVLGEALSSTHRVLAPDMPGRGKSDWLRNPLDYIAPTYLTTLTALICASGAEDVTWVGTSMGALLGIMAASLPETPVKRLVVNDAGPVLDPAAIARIGQYFGTDPTFATYGELAAYVRTISAPFGPLTDEQWEHVTRTNARQRDDGKWGVGYDPAIAIPFRAQPTAANLWPLWDAIRCPTLVLRGAVSDLLASETAREMTERGPKPRVIEFAGVGHAPMLLARDQVDAVVDFVRSTV